MDEIYTYITDLPPSVHECVAECADGYTIYIDDKLSVSGRQKAYLHALKHIKENDFEKECADLIEVDAHE